MAPAGVVAALRNLIVSGRFKAGERLAELPLAEELGVSRTPVRLAVRTLEHEGLLERSGRRGYAVRAFSEADVRCAVDVRSVLEGLAARRLAEHGLSPAVHAQLAACLDEGEQVLAKGRLDAGDIDAWSRLNEVFHRTIAGAGESRVVAEAIERNNRLPFASSDSITVDRSALAKEYEKLRVAQLQHRLVFEALENREAARVEGLMREHAYIGVRYLRHL
ncbi:MAG: GntR family transcriptional regulator [Rubrivivax sp. SCN 71-131]|nr:MAG: GntR family transcriptional regulator [Rubrivivax sp. SCN 71-131]